MPSFETVEQAIALAGLKITATNTYSIKGDLQDQFLYCSKQNPELYFDESLRPGVSSFSAVANKDEVENGLAALRASIDTREIDEIIKSYQNNLGDCLYIIAEKLTS
jgi:hypothetical protein